MLSWPKGPHPDDGIWGSVWYEKTYKSSSFIGENRVYPKLTDYQKSVVDMAYPFYDRLNSFVKFSQ